MTPSDGMTPRAIETDLGESRDRVAIAALELCTDLHIRAMIGGGPILAGYGIVAPTISRNTSLLVDPASIGHLHAALRERGWRDVRPRRGPHILPSARLVLVHEDEPAGLLLYSVIPGFFADPEETFDRIWERHKEVPLRGTTVRAVGRVASAVLASHDGLGGRVARQRSSFVFFVNQFQILLTQPERRAVGDLVRQMGGCAEMSDLLEALGLEPCAFALPSLAYVQWRLQVTDASDQTRRALAMLELSPAGRDVMYRSNTGRPRSFGDIARMATALPATARAILGARRRWAAVNAAN